MRKFTLALSMLAMGSIVYGQQMNNLQHRLSKMTDITVKTETQNTKRDVIAAGDVLFSETFDSTAWHTANNNGVAVPENMPNGWTAFDATGNGYYWRWSTTGPRGAYTSSPALEPNNNSIVKSTSDALPGGEKGFMQMEPDFYNTDSEGNPLETETDMDSYIQTAAIDASANSAVSIYFEQWHRFCCSAYGVDAGPKLLVSSNNTDWTQYDVHSASVNATPKFNPGRVELSISAVAANQSTVYIRFHLKGMSSYFWSIDDITVFEPQPYDIRVGEYWLDYSQEQLWYFNDTYASKGFSSAPTNSPFHAFQKFTTSRAKIVNYGSAAMTNVQFTTKIMKGETVLDSKTSEAISTLPIGSMDTIVVRHDYQIERTSENIGAYHYEGLVFGTEEDLLPTNNEYKYNFNITENLFGFTDPVNSATDRTSPFSYVGAVDGNSVGAVYMFNPPTETLADGTPAPFIAKGVNVFIQNDNYNYTIWRAEGIAMLKAVLIAGVQNPTSGEWEFSLDNTFAETDQVSIDSTTARSWVYIPFNVDGASEKFTPTVEGQQYLVLIKFYTDNKRFFIGADKFTRASYYSHFIQVQTNDPGPTAADLSSSIEFIVDRTGQNPTGTAHVIVENKKPSTGVIEPAVGAVVEFRTQDENLEDVTTVYTADATGKVEITGLRAGTYAFLAKFGGKEIRNAVTIVGSGVSEKKIMFEVEAGGVRPALLSGVKMYPNPANNSVTIESTATKIVVSNILGQVVEVINNPAQSHTLSIANYTTGVYLVTLSDNNGSTTTQRLIKQ